MKWLAVLLAALSVFAVAKTDAPAWEVRDDFATILADAGAVGTIVVLDEADERWYVTNRERAESPLPPAGTFDIFTALAAADESTARSGAGGANPGADDLEARRMDYWLERVDYGNRRASGSVDRYASNGSLRISARDQVLFLRRLADGELPFSAGAQSTVRAAIVDPGASGANAVLRGKAGALPSGAPGAVGWHVGWVERDGRRWFFAINVDVTDTATKHDEITHRALAAVGALAG